MQKKKKKANENKALAVWALCWFEAMVAFLMFWMTLRKNKYSWNEEGKAESVWTSIPHVGKKREASVQ